jgi:hypothetical protein
MMVNGNYFQFDHKSLFNSEKTIYGFKNRKSFFLDLNSSFLQTRLWESATAKHWNLLEA